ncbi:MAG: hypothetical protein LBD07_05585 [Spirochaetaceae bacterium]|nr:hypothetical protein [Spirochaetaceae bacterium]
MTINVTNQGAVKLLHDLEGLGLIQVSAPAQENAANHAVPHTQRTGFLKGSVSVPADFDTMGQETISALFEGSL